MSIRLEVIIQSTVYGTVGWGDSALFSIFETVHISIDQVYFKEFNSKKSATSAVCPAKFSFSTIHRDLKNQYYCPSSKSSFLQQRVFLPQKLPVYTPSFSPPPLPMLGVGLVQGCHAAAEAVLGPMCQSSQAGPHAAAAVVAASEMAEAATTAAGAAKCCAS